MPEHGALLNSTVGEALKDAEDGTGTADSPLESSDTIEETQEAETAEVTTDAMGSNGAEVSDSVKPYTGGSNG